MLVEALTFTFTDEFDAEVRNICGTRKFVVAI